MLGVFRLTAPLVEIGRFESLMNKREKIRNVYCIYAIDTVPFQDQI